MKATILVLAGLVVIAGIGLLLIGCWRASPGPQDDADSDESAEVSSEGPLLEGLVAVVSGRVVVAETGEPLAEAHVESGSAVATTDADGTFQLTVPVAADAAENASVDMYCTPRDPRYARKRIRGVRVAPGEETKGLLFEVGPGSCSIEGVVLEGQDRTPAAGLWVRLFERNRERPYYMVDDWRFVVTAETTDGAFKIEGLRPSMYYLEAFRPEWNCVASRKELTVFNQTEPFRVTLYVGTRNTWVLTGVVTGPAGEPVNNAALWMMNGDRYIYHPGLSDAEGRYGLYAYHKPSASNLSVMVFHPDYALKYVEIGSEDKPVLSLDVSLARAPRVAGVVTDEAGKPLSDVTMTIEGEALGLQTPEWFWYLPNPRTKRMTGDDGAYAFAYLLPGEYVVTAAREKYLVEERTVTVGATGDQRCDFTLDPGTVICGTVYDESGEPLQVRSVVAVGPDGKERCAAASEADGKFTLKPLARGEPVDVLVLADQVDMASDEPFYYAKVEGVEPGREDLRIDAQLMRRGTVEIAVVEAATGDPVTAYKVWASSHPRSGVVGVARRFVVAPTYGRAGVDDETGRVALTGLLPGAHTFTVMARGYERTTSEVVEVPSGGTVELRIELKRPEKPEG